MESLTLSAWVRLDDQDTAEASLLRVQRTPDEGRHSPLWLVGKIGSSLVAKHWGRGMATPPGSLPRGRWMHVVLTLGPAADGWETVLYIDGETRARSRELISAPLGPAFLPDTGWLEIGGPGVAMDDVAIWRQTLTPEQVAALHILGEDYCCDAAEVDMLFNAPRDDAVRIGTGIDGACQRWRTAAG